MTINTQKITTLIRDGCHGTYMYHVDILFSRKKDTISMSLHCQTKTLLYKFFFAIVRLDTKHENSIEQSNHGRHCIPKMPLKYCNR